MAVLTVRLTHWILVVAAAFAIVAVPLAMGGWFRAWILFPLVALVAGALFVADRSLPFVVRAGNAPTIAVLVLIGTAGLLSFLHPTQHFTTNRDPGIYSVTGLWLEREGSILFDSLSPEFEATGRTVPQAAGFYNVRDDGKLEPQFAHLTHTALGAAAMVGSEALLTRTNVLVGAASLLVLFVLIQQFTSGWAAAAATGALAFSLPQIYFTRGPYSEPLAQLLLLGAVAVLASGRPLSRGHALLAGLLIGALLGSRIDAVLILPALVVLAVAWVLSGRRGRELAWIGAGTIVTGTIGFVDLQYFAGSYLAEHSEQVGGALRLTAGATGLSVAVLLARGPLARRLATLAPQRERIAVGAAALGWAVMLAVLFIWPRFPAYRSRDTGLVVGLQRRQGFEDDPPRSFLEQSPEWLTWYLGWPLVLLAVVGASVVIYRLITRWSWPLFASVVILGLPTAVYLYRPSITGDHLWVMRRFLPAALPFVALVGAIGADWLRSQLSLDRAREGFATFAISSVVVVGAMAGSFQYWTFREFRLDTATMHQMCEVLDGRPVLVDDRGTLGPQFAQTLAAACAVETGRVQPHELGEVAEAAAEQYGRSDVQLMVMSRSSELADQHPGLQLEASLSYRVQEIERSVGRPPIGSEQDPENRSDVHFYVVEP